MMSVGEGGGLRGIDSDMMDANYEVISFGLPAFFFRDSPAP
jgi:hypothetical protein